MGPEDERHLRRLPRIPVVVNMATKPKYTLEDLEVQLLYFADAADFEEYGGDDPEPVMAANKEVARRLRKMADRVSDQIMRREQRG